MTRDDKPGPGESKTRRRQLRMIIYLSASVVIGALIGALLSSSQQGTGNFFSSDIAELSLDPAVAIGLAAVIFLAFVIFPLWGFTQIDEVLREQNLLGFTGGAISVMAGYPIWVILYAGGFVEQPHAFGLFVLLYVGTVLSFLFAKLRERLSF